MKKIEDFRKVLEIQESLIDLKEPLVSPSRLFLHKGKVSKISRKGDFQERFLFLVSLFAYLFVDWTMSLILKWGQLRSAFNN